MQAELIGSSNNSGSNEMEWKIARNTPRHQALMRLTCTLATSPPIKHGCHAQRLLPKEVRPQAHIVGRKARDDDGHDLGAAAACRQQKQDENFTMHKVKQQAAQ